MSDTLQDAIARTEQLSDVQLKERLRPHVPKTIDRIVGLVNSRNENVALGASKYILGKFLADLKAIEVGGGLNASGEREPIRLFINTGHGFIPASVTTSTSSAGGFAEQSKAIQDADLAPESTQDNDGDIRDSQTSTP